MEYKDKVSIILHGRINRKVDINNTITEYKKYGKIILSAYIHEMDYLKEAIQNWDDITVVLNDINEYDKQMKEYPMYSTQYYQLQTTKKGLDVVDTPYVIKTRIDHYYSNLDTLIKRCFETNKICTISIFTRSFYQYKYHLSDNLFMGKTDEIREVIHLSIEQYPFPNQHLYPNETQLWKPYITSKAGNLNTDADINAYIHVLSQLFEIIDIYSFKPYLFKYGDRVVNLFREQHHDTVGYLLHGCDDGVISAV